MSIPLLHSAGSSSLEALRYSRLETCATLAEPDVHRFNPGIIALAFGI